MNTCIVILGATGDLARRKLIPALYYLRKNGLLASTFTWVGVAQDTVTLTELVNRACSQLPDYDPLIMQELIKQGTYCSMSLNQSSDYAILKQILTKITPNSNLLFYFALPSDLFCTVTKNLVAHTILQKQDSDASPWQRVVFEKPFGHDLVSATALNSCLLEFLHEQQVWRVDHYLSKNIVHAITPLRFTNTLLNASWSHEYIDHVLIELTEDLSIQGRGGYYDNYGALKDVMQNHLLQLLALIAMEEPASLTCEQIAQAKAIVLKKTTITSGLLGQYNGYLQDASVTQRSTTETFAMVKAMVYTPRWHNVPFFLRTGKALDKQEVKISIHYKPTKLSTNNSHSILSIHVEPHAGIALYLTNHQTSIDNKSVKTEYLYPVDFSQEKILAHERLLYSILQGDHYSSVGWTEIACAWKIIDAAKQQNFPLYYYEKGSKGPQEQTEWLIKNMQQ